ncbi:MAG: hypothetical protein EBS34_02715 [Flavobacteriales bacterium]|nr:hypothetical protein [Flavobacteriales bacterium]
MVKITIETEQCRQWVRVVGQEKAIKTPPYQVSNLTTCLNPKPTLFFAHLLYIAERQRSAFNRIYAYCVAMILFYHFAINIGMNIGFAPVIGIPLPFFSYGGSSMMSFSLMMFILLKLDSQRKDVLR